MIYIFYTRFDTQISPDNWSGLLQYVPLDLIKKSKVYRRWQDQHAFLLGRLLLMESLNKIGLKKNAISDIKYNEFGKPFLSNDIDFNISHSGNFVVCVIGEKLKLGIDIETIQTIDFKDFKYIITDQEWEEIHKSEDPTRKFFRLWTIKESVIKAEQQGLSISLLDLNINNNEVRNHNNVWYLHELILDPNICTCLATNSIDPKLELFEVDFSFGIKEKKITRIDIKKVPESF